jgi:hypothetical protein
MKNDSQGNRVLVYLSKISRGAGLKTNFRWEKNEIICEA